MTQVFGFRARQAPVIDSTISPVRPTLGPCADRVRSMGEQTAPARCTTRFVEGSLRAAFGVTVMR